MENLLEKKRQHIERRKQAIASQEKLMKQVERKERTRRLIELGGLIVKAQLEDLNESTLYGALCHIKTLSSDDKLTSQWTTQGTQKLNIETINKTPIVVTFEEKPSLVIRQSMRDGGLKWNALRSEWEGRVDLEKVKTILENSTAKITVLEQKIAA